MRETGIQSKTSERERGKKLKETNFNDKMKYLGKLTSALAV